MGGFVGTNFLFVVLLMKETLKIFGSFGCCCPLLVLLRLGEDDWSDLLFDET